MLVYYAENNKDSVVYNAVLLLCLTMILDVMWFLL